MLNDLRPEGLLFTVLDDAELGGVVVGYPSQGGFEAALVHAAFGRTHRIGKGVQIELEPAIRQHRDFNLYLLAELAEGDWFAEQRLGAGRGG